jgi:mannitol/fructose-specific phosphotransferase system IIA component (Ntr-type)
MSCAASVPETEPSPQSQPALSQSLSAKRIIIWDGPIEKEAALRTLVAAVGREDGIKDLDALFGDIMKREEQGSTFFNEGVAFPHVRVDGLVRPIIALGLTKRGISDISTEKPIEIVFLILAPAQSPDIQVQLLGLTSRAAQDRHLLQRLRSVRTAEEAMRLISNWEEPDRLRES